MAFRAVRASCLIWAFGRRPARPRFRFRYKLFSLAATVIDLCLELLDWAKFRQTKGAVKLHLSLDHDGYLRFAHITEGSVHEVNVTQELELPTGSIVVLDRGYTDFDLFAPWCTKGVYFVTRQKSNAAYEVIETREIPQDRGDFPTRLPSIRDR